MERAYVVCPDCHKHVRKKGYAAHRRHCRHKEDAEEEARPKKKRRPADLPNFWGGLWWVISNPLKTAWLLVLLYCFAGWLQEAIHSLIAVPAANQVKQLAAQGWDIYQESQQERERQRRDERMLSAESLVETLTKKLGSGELMPEWLQ